MILDTFQKVALSVGLFFLAGSCAVPPWVCERTTFAPAWQSSGTSITITEEPVGYWPIGSFRSAEMHELPDGQGRARVIHHVQWGRLWAQLFLIAFATAALLVVLSIPHIPPAWTSDSKAAQ